MRRNADEIVARNRPLAQYIWRGSSALVVTNEGVTGDLKIAGFYFRQTRYLDKLELRINGELPFLCSTAEVAQNQLEFTYIFPPVTDAVNKSAAGGSGSGGTPSRHGILTRTLDLMLRYTLHPAACDVELTIVNRWDEVAEFTLEWLVDADYAGVTEILGEERKQQAAVAQETVDGKAVVFRYKHDQLPYTTRIEARDSLQWQLGERRLLTTIQASRQQPLVTRLRIQAEDFEGPIDDAGREARERSLQAWLSNATMLHAPAETPIVSLTNRALRDVGSLAILESDEESWMYPGAGVPLYLNVWGRDALTTTWQIGAFDRCDMLRAVLSHVARSPGTEVVHETEEEPGKILNRESPTPTSRLGIEPFLRFYGDFASPLMFIIGLGQFFAWTNDVDTLRRHWPVAKGVLDWARKYGDRDGDGYLEYVKHAEQGPKHQGWKDSDNAVVDADGDQVEPPIAASEIQAYWFAALQFMSILSLFVGEKREAKRLWDEADELKQRFNRDFWMDDEGFVAFGLDSKKQQIRSVASNGGHCIAAGIINTEKLPRVVRRLFQPDMFSGWGIRTLSSLNRGYNPLDYHLGSVWPVENGTILLGLRRYGFDDRVVELARALSDLALIWPGGRIPECVGGYGRDEYGHPGAYPQANAPQAWNQSIWVVVMQSLLGLQPVAPFHTLAVDPILPWWLPEVTVKNLRVGTAKATIRFRRDDTGASHFDVLETEGKLRVVRQQPINDLGTHWWNRLGALVTG